MRKIFLYSLMILLSVALTEISLRIVDLLWPNRILSNIDPIVKDDILGHRPNPKNPDHDKRGFRNKTIPPHPDIIALGDSQTYGTGVNREEAWPQQLERLTGLQVYNMAFGGYGPVHYLLLTDEVLAMGPRMVIVAFYAGNDLFDSFNMVYHTKNRLEQLKTNDIRTVEELKKLQSTETIQEKAKKADINIGKSLAEENLFIKFKSFLNDHFKCYKLLSFFKNHVLNISLEDPDKIWSHLKEAASSHKNAIVFERDNLRTILTPKYRLSVLNLNDARISEGLNISLQSFKLMNNKFSQAGHQFYVLFIPTKEMVFSCLAQGKQDQDYLDLVDNEKAMWEKTRNFLRANGIGYIDSEILLQKELIHGSQPYSIYDDGHPNPLGHRVIAQSVADFLKQTTASQAGH